MIKGYVCHPETTSHVLHTAELLANGINKRKRRMRACDSEWQPGEASACSHVDHLYSAMYHDMPDLNERNEQGNVTWLWD